MNVALPTCVFDDIIGSLPLAHLCMARRAAPFVATIPFRDRIRARAAMEPHGLVSETLEFCHGDETLTMESIETVAEFMMNVKTLSVASPSLLRDCSADRILKSAVVLPTPTLLWASVPPSTTQKYIFRPNGWLYSELLDCLPEVEDFISTTLASIVDPFDPIPVPFATAFRRVVLIRGIQITSDRVQHAYRSSIACARESLAEELWIGAINDIHGKDPSVAAAELALAILEFCLKEVVLFGRIRLQQIVVFVTGKFVDEEHLRIAVRNVIGLLC